MYDRMVADNRYLGVVQMTNWLAVLKAHKKGGETMDWIKVLQHGLAAFCFAVLAAVVYALIGALTISLGYKPEGVLVQFVWQFLVYPALVGIIGALTNWYKHLTMTPAPVATAIPAK